MIRRLSPALLVGQFFADLVLTLLAVKLGEQVRLHIVTHWERRGEVFASVDWQVYVLVVAIWAVFFFVFGVFEPRRRTSLLSELLNLWLTISVSMLVLASLFYLLANDPNSAPSRLFFGYFYLLDLALLTAAHSGFDRVLQSMRKRGKHVRRVLLVGSGVPGRQVSVRLRGRAGQGVLLVGYVADETAPELDGLSRLGPMADTCRVVQANDIDEVVMALPAEQHLEALRMAAELQSLDVAVRIMPDVFELVAMKARIDDLFGLPLVSISEPSIGPIQARVKRVFDLVVAGTLLLLVSPVLLAIAIWVRFDSKGPVFIHQRRIGAAGKTFLMHKFRSMEWRPEELDVAAEKQRDDPRVTRVGRFIRRTSLDELPQFWNVITGDMSLVGPRPELPAIVEGYEPWQRKRLNVPPGMTGWWQVNGRSERSMYQNTEIDLFYVQNYSILLDLQILARTLGAVIKGKGAF